MNRYLIGATASLMALSLVACSGNNKSKKSSESTTSNKKEVQELLEVKDNIITQSVDIKKANILIDANTQNIIVSVPFERSKENVLFSGTEYFTSSAGTEMLDENKQLIGYKYAITQHDIVLNIKRYKKLVDAWNDVYARYIVISAEFNGKVTEEISLAEVDGVKLINPNLNKEEYEQTLLDIKTQIEDNDKFMLKTKRIKDYYLNFAAIDNDTAEDITENSDKVKKQTAPASKHKGFLAQIDNFFQETKVKVTYIKDLVTAGAKDGLIQLDRDLEAALERYEEALNLEHRVKRDVDIISITKYMFVYSEFAKGTLAYHLNSKMPSVAGPGEAPESRDAKLYQHTTGMEH